ncbi:hypothetical protein Cni_G09827 [Canna indica]|uniref:Uncharacterized protein n=1 Tax=Canna indica TaxID=4628 RepID=A0AAQ3K4Q8_9LILI|nr:hypothetical protein Cni_G09827 [Canna indica]
MASNKVFVAAVFCMIFLAVDVVVAFSDSLYANVDNSCYCDCMINRCMTDLQATREACAPACHEGCIQVGLSGRIDKDDFCGY